MNRLLLRRIRLFLRNEEGVTAVECALMLALVVVICVIVLSPPPISKAAGEDPPLVLETHAK